MESEPRRNLGMLDSSAPVIPILIEVEIVLFDSQLLPSFFRKQLLHMKMLTSQSNGIDYVIWCRISPMPVGLQEY